MVDAQDHIGPLQHQKPYTSKYAPTLGLLQKQHKPNMTIYIYIRIQPPTVKREREGERETN
jgi:hypothetical protein